MFVLQKWGLFVLLCCATVFANAQTPTTANQIKAVFLFNFSKFVNWPPDALNNAPFVIGILGKDPFGPYIERVVEGEKMNGQPIVVQRYDDVKDVKNCQILYINKSNSAEIARSLSAHGMLTVSDGENFATSGGIVRFYLENNRLHLQINVKQAKAADLQISSKLLRIADVIE
ncbi:YfiR family protein [Flavisolibacter ginsenosidimutans]|uniref:YfiR family protein n=1 Tax=Flavisolibacter ginsenosidimutans TaxID=661481 RepID=UPI00155A4B86|nr:YfiR family protein [Flavisolibacter ginsenosidimutans]